MKIKNISNKKRGLVPTSVEIVLTTKGGTKRNLKLEPGNYVYCERLDNNMPIRLFQQKGILEISEEEKTENFEYYTIYQEETSIVKQFIEKVVNVFSREEDFSSEEEGSLNNENLNDENLEIFVEIEETKLVIEPEVEQEPESIEVEVIVPEDSLKNKGGRPKGSKNKTKKKKAKTKKSVVKPLKK